MIKKSLIVLFLLALLLLFLVRAQTGLPSQEELQNDPVVNATQKLQESIEEKKWEYLSEQWKEILLKNKYISGVNDLFRKINFVFLILFGQNYELSLTLFIVFLLWIFFLFIFWNVFSTYAPFSKGVSFVIGLGFVVVLAQIKLLNLFATVIFKIIFFKEGIWKWISLILILFGFLFILGFVQYVLRDARKSKKEALELQQKHEQRILHQTIQGIAEGNK